MHKFTFSIFLTIITAVLLVSCAPKSTTEMIQPSFLEPIEGSEYSRVIVTEKAAGRLGIETSPVREEAINRSQSLNSEVVAPPDGPEAGGNRFWVRVSLTESIQQMVDRQMPARVVSVTDHNNNGDDDDENGEGMIAEPDDWLGDDDDDDLHDLYYSVSNPAQSLTEGQRVLLEIPMLGSGSVYKVVPYSAVLYGVHGETWVYTNTDHLTYVRAPITIEFFYKDLAVLSEGPEIGTPVVTVGAAELFGTETGVSK